MDEKPLTVAKLLPSKKQTEWRWPAAANFILGGAGAGFYVLSFITMLFEHGIFLNTDPVLFGWLGPVLAIIGLAILVTEAGRPLRGRYLIHHLQSAWISRETLAFVFFILAVVCDYLFPHLVLKLFAVLTALLFMLSQGFIAYSARAIPAWNVLVMPIFFLTSGLASGTGVALLLAASGSHLSLGSLVFLSLVCTILNLTVWIIYLRYPGAVAFRSATVALKRPPAIFLTVVLGHMFPLLLLFLIQLSGYLGIGEMLQVIFLIGSGSAVILSAIVQKSLIILAAGYTREIIL
jgi:formate-dependent nitrite reductase membrane component NrfD